MKRWTASHTGDVVTIQLPGLTATPYHIMVQSDEHVDSPSHLAALWTSHVERAARHNMPILSMGDMFDAIGGRYDKRRDPAELAAEHLPRRDYYDAVVESVARQLKPYAQHYALLARGNHECSILKHTETDLTQRLADALPGFRGALGGYTGYVRLRFGQSYEHLIWYSHGKRGSAPVTRGVINTNRRAVWLRDPDTILSGDSHEAWFMPVVRETVTGDTRGWAAQWHVQMPSYVRNTDTLSWVAQREFAPKPVGCWLLGFSYTKTAGVERTVTFISGESNG